jgi:hypothetical protein
LLGRSILPTEAYKELYEVEEITSSRLADILLAEGLRKGIIEFHSAQSAIIAVIPETTNNKQPVWANA